MGTYIYSGLHPRKGTIPILTFFPSLGGKPVVAMKSCVTIEGTTLQKVKVKEVKAIMDAYEQFLIPDIYVTDSEYDYALLVENLDNESVPEKVKNCSSKPGDSFIGIIIDHDPRDETYTVGCGPQVFRNVSSDFISINPRSEFPCVQIQRTPDSCISCDNICDVEAEIKKLLDPAAAIIPNESLTSSHHSNKHNKRHFTPSPAAVSQAQSNPTKSNIPKPPAASATSLSKISTLPQSQKVSTHVPASQSNLKPSVQQTQKNASKTMEFKPFTGWCTTLKSESLLPEAQHTPQEISWGSTSSRNPAHAEEDPWAVPDSDEPFRHTAKTPLTEILLEQKQRSTTNCSNLKPLTRPISPLSFRSCNSQSQSNSIKSSNSVLSTSSANSCYRSIFSNAQTSNNSTKSTNSTFFTSSASSLTHESREEDSASPLSYEYFEEDPWAIPDPAEPFGRSGKSSFIECLNEQKSTIKKSKNAVSKYTASSQFLKSVPPQAQTNSPKSLTPSTTSSSSISFILQAYTSQSNPFISPASSWYTAYTSPAYGSDLEPITSTVSSRRYESLLSQAPHESTSQHTSPTVVPTRPNETAIQAAASASSETTLDDFEALRPTLSSCKQTKLIEDLKTVTI